MTDNTTKPTPGPWTVRDRASDSVRTQIEHGVSLEDWRYAIDVPRPPFAFGGIGALVCSREADAEANARLIAAAPDLLSALLWVSEHAYAGGKSFADLPIVRAAIAKATGATP